MLTIRSYEPRDRPSVRSICCQNAFGRDVSAFFEDRELFADYWTKYYTDENPEHSLVVEHDGDVVGYWLASTDYKAFFRYMSRHIGPRVVGTLIWQITGRRYRTAASYRFARWVLSRSWREIPDFPSDGYPAQWHINLGPAAQNQNLQTVLVNRFLDKLEDLGVGGVQTAVTEPDDRSIYLKMALRRRCWQWDVHATKPTTLLSTVENRDIAASNIIMGWKIDEIRKFINYYGRRSRF